jgi:hypothetical protein
MKSFVIALFAVSVLAGCTPKEEAATTPAPAAAPAPAAGGSVAGGAGAADASISEAGKNVDSYMGSKLKEAEEKAAKKAKDGK